MTHNKAYDILCKVEPVKLPSYLINRDVCNVTNDICSFGHVCAVHASFCPRHEEQSKQLLASRLTRLVICSQSSTKENAK